MKTKCTYSKMMINVLGNDIISWRKRVEYHQSRRWMHTEEWLSDKNMNVRLLGHTATNWQYVAQWARDQECQIRLQGHQYTQWKHNAYWSLDKFKSIKERGNLYTQNKVSNTNMRDQLNPLFNLN